MKPMPWKARFKRYAVNLFLAWDQLFLNVLPAPLFNWIDFGSPRNGWYGDPDETLCSVAGKIRDRYYGGRKGAVSIRRHPVAGCVDWLMEWIDRDHTVEAIEGDEGKRSL